MTHVLFVYDRPDALTTLPEETRQAIYREYQALADVPDLTGHRLQPGTTATTLTICDDHEELRHQPVLQGSLRLTGFYLLKTDDPDRATQVAAQIPALRTGGAIEIHQLANE